ncbi:MAG: hypothetical protein L6U16_06265 [Porphyromonadaceae bacterium]|nr:MAG: hypothetical protein L6U16_06265 [Porphyromonadaceae bacterium]
MGITQPNFQELANSNRILVELPGVKDRERVKKMLQQTANLEFYQTYKYSEIANDFQSLWCRFWQEKLRNQRLAAPTLQTLKPLPTLLRKKQNLRWLKPRRWLLAISTSPRLSKSPAMAAW